MLFKKQHKEKSYTQNFIFRMRIDSNLLHFKNNSNRFRYKMKLLYEFHFLTSINNWFKINYKLIERTWNNNNDNDDGEG